MRRACWLLLMMIAINGCRAVDPASRDATRMQRTELIFGLSMSDGEQVDEDQWQQFVGEVVTPRFPDGLTILDATGQWRESGGTILRERSKVVLILHKGGARDVAKLDEIRAEYERRFHEESVIRESGPAWVSF